MTIRNKSTTILEQDEDWWIAYCLEIPGANGQGRTKEECLENLREASQLILEDGSEDALRGVPPDVARRVATVD